MCRWLPGMTGSFNITPVDDDCSVRRACACGRLGLGHNPEIAMLMEWAVHEFQIIL